MTQAGLELAVLSMLLSNGQSSCFSLQRIGLMGLCHTLRLNLCFMTRKVILRQKGKPPLIFLTFSEYKEGTGSLTASTLAVG